ncbi:hypothetical protein [Streptomyces sp. CB03911]|uniref:DUF6197 family protein n=1 Tax=Streptomyces sp. CB03911 TaxID=1804758 RepID=UPI00093C319E|nr:hypothetical protein [Streptomyces sp. CB03911]OKI14189.1 hypothetical protein A6A07_13640 [Streptomyces sp. CB03911]
MPATLTAPRIDVDAAGLLLVAEVEAYVRSLTPAAVRPPRLDVAQLLADFPADVDTAPAAGPWHAGFTLPAPGLADRLRGRHPTLAVTASQHLQLVSRYIAEHGWTQGALWESTGRVCVLGAHLRVLAAGYGTPATAVQARILIGNALGAAGTPMPVDDWNDLPTTCETDVRQLLRRAAART